jgi:hypothetical protein
MTFANREESRARGNPVTLYYFRYGSDAASYHAYTDAEFSVDGPDSSEATIAYTPIPIARGAVTSQGNLDKTIIPVTVPQDAELCDHFRDFAPAQVVTAVIRQGHLGDPDGEFPVVFSGRVVGMKFEASEATFELEPASTSMRRNGLRRHWQIGCPHVLYGDQCRASMTAATVTQTVQAVSGTSIELPDSWFGSIAIEKYIGGMARWTNDAGNTELRRILQIIDGRDLLLSGFLRDLEATDSIDLILGCDHTQDDCLNLHVTDESPSGPNINNYGGHDWIPQKNPFGAINRFE